MSWSRIVNLYLDTEAYGKPYPLLESLTGSSPLQQIGFVSANKWKLRIWPRQKGYAQGAVSSPVQLDSAFTIVFSGKKKSAISSGMLLFKAIGFTEVSIGPDWYYEAELSLRTDELLAAFGTDTSIIVRCDIDIQQSGNVEDMTFQFDATINLKVDNGETDPTPAAPPYPNPADLFVGANLLKAAIPSGQDYVDVDLTPYSLAGAPIVLPGAVIKPSAGADNLLAVGVSGITATTFRIHFATTAPAAGYFATALYK